jgi:CelD/BcsL family acetyltransferase involved in cellulose biosynthesis
MELKTRLDIPWQNKQIQLRYSISDLCLFRVAFTGKAYRCPFDPFSTDCLSAEDLPGHLPGNGDFVALNDVRIREIYPRLRPFADGFLYCLNQGPNYFIDIKGTYEDYLKSLASKTRSTLKRKIRKFAELSGGDIDFRVYRSPEEVREYHRNARAVAAQTYQEKLFQGALPEGDAFASKMEKLAASGQMRGFLLFLQGRPVAYLYVPFSEGVGEYSYLGYAPEFAEHSPGTVLLHQAIESLFRDKSIRFFNFGFGANQTKLMYSTGQFLRADIYYFRNTFRNRAALYGHSAADAFSAFCGRTLDRIGLRRLVKRWMRSG